MTIVILKDCLKQVVGSLSVIDFSIILLKMLLKSKLICWLCEVRIPAGPLQIWVRIQTCQFSILLRLIEVDKSNCILSRKKKQGRRTTRVALAPFSCFVEFGFVVLASRTAPIIREVLERRSRRDIPAWIADLV